MSQTILVIDDDPDLIELIQSVLQVDGYEVVGCPNSSLALEMTRCYAPALIFLDLYMPRPTGWEILQELRNDAVMAATPVLIVSALDGESSESELLPVQGTSPVNVLCKPFEIDELVTRVRRLLESEPSDSIRYDSRGERTASLL